MEVFIEKKNMKKKLKFSGTVEALLKKLNLNPESVIVVKDKTVVTERDKLYDTDHVEILSVVSGG
jgi:thiamine biosynthesis protein ThiS